ncbi:amidohydrolase family protein [Vibrio sp. WXL210]|uniref:amidohydrolase family protein n=1 Tax=Vibrio sp. WXL210 TaxID=3450709 RepID=UPI003EC7780E
MTKQLSVAVAISAALFASGGFCAEDATIYDVVIEQGRVIDPASGTNEIMNIGIVDGSIVTLNNDKLVGDKVIDAQGKVVAPGFIDLHSHTPFSFGESLQLRDGVTTPLDLEAGAYPVTDYGMFIRDKARANYGASVGFYAARIKVIEGRDQSYIVTEKGAHPFAGPAFTQQATPEQIEELKQHLTDGINQGGIGIGLPLDYMTEAISDDELNMVFKLAKDLNVPLFAHIRRGVNGDIGPLNDVLKLSQKYGTALHLCHINANAMGNIGNWLAAIDEANEKGANVTVEAFPYTAGSTSISADVFGRDWQEIFDISYEDVQWAATGEFLTKETFEQKRREEPGGMVIHHYMKEEWLETALTYPGMIVSSDAMPTLNANVKANPNGAGSFTRLLTHYVRDTKLLSLEQAIAMSSYYPARLIEEAAPAFKRKGRIQVGSDADLLVFELDNLSSNAAYMDPFAPATGWDYILVNGQVVLEGDKLTKERPGQFILSTHP